MPQGVRAVSPGRRPGREGAPPLKGAWGVSTASAPTFKEANVRLRMSLYQLKPGTGLGPTYGAWDVSESSLADSGSSETPLASD